MGRTMRGVGRRRWGGGRGGTQEEGEEDELVWFDPIISRQSGGMDLIRRRQLLDERVLVLLISHRTVYHADKWLHLRRRHIDAPGCCCCCRFCCALVAGVYSTVYNEFGCGGGVVYWWYIFLLWKLSVHWANWRGPNQLQEYQPLSRVQYLKEWIDGRNGCE